MTSELSPSERQAKIDNIFVDHARNQQVASALKRFHLPVEGGTPRTGTISAIVGDSRVGKTYAVERYLSQFQSTVSEGQVERPVVLVDTPVSCTSVGLPLAFMDAYGIPATKQKSLGALQNLVPKVLQQHKTKLVVLDEAQEVFRPNNRHVLQFARGFLRKLLNTGQVGIICVGLKETYELIADDAQLKGRGGLPYTLVQPYSWERTEDRKYFQLLCKLIGDLLPFQENPRLGNASLSWSLFYVSQGNIGRLKDFIAAAAFEAINDGSETVTKKHFAFAFDERKKPGEHFNPFSHDPSVAPKQAAPSKELKRAVDPFSKVTA